MSLHHRQSWQAVQCGLLLALKQSFRENVASSGGSYKCDFLVLLQDPEVLPYLREQKRETYDINLEVSLGSWTDGADGVGAGAFSALFYYLKARI